MVVVSHWIMAILNPPPDHTHPSSPSSDHLNRGESEHALRLLGPNPCTRKFMCSI